MKISEKYLTEIIKSVIMENRKVLKVGNPAPSAPPMPDMGMPPMDAAGAPDNPNAMGAPMNGMDPNAMGGAPDAEIDNQFDTDFDAGVEADEEADPKHYIQQLTGKLSQSINSFNGEQGPDTGLCKYVASMIIAATCKNLDDKAKKELVEKINSANASDEEIPEEPEGEETPQDEMPPEEPQEQQPMMERILTKQELLELVGGVQDRQDNLPDKKQKNAKKTIFSGKPF